ncbi:Serine/threonine-protein kinase PrkC [Variovorax sp. PBS-H4]|uniref:protein kinase domain-containing protein n=1 Tax=Variovorax sp. PBS-H4 TaxID=434008 RepID=UPI00131969A9|nr:protein kinase [Variovorax sp. PBS-H4]VTU39574.1 Serine/threonine-protein kinase PrkC [Variovorax sp. PBS-H4]
MQPSGKTQVRFFQANREGSNKYVGPANARTVEQLGLKEKGEARIGFKVEGTVIFAKERPGPRAPGAFNHGLGSVLGRSKNRKLAAGAALKRLEMKVKELPADQRTTHVIVRLNDVRTQLTKWGTVAAQDLQLLFDSIADAKTTAAANKAKRHFDANVKDAAVALSSPQGRLSILQAGGRNVVPPFTQTSIREFLTFVKNTAAFDLSIAGIDPLAYKQAIAFAKNWTQALPKQALGKPEDRYLIDRLAKMVLEGCGSPPDVAPQVPPQFSFIDDRTLQRIGDGALFVRDDTAKFGIGGFGSISAYKCGAESIVVKELIQDEPDPNLSPEQNAEVRNAMVQKALDEVRVHTQASQGADHVVGIHGTVRTDERVLLILEHAPNGESGTVRTNLDEAVKRGDLDPQESYGAKMLMFVDMVKGADQVHGNGVMHLDLKPENYFVDEKGRMKLGDFGTSHGVLGTFGQPGIASIDYTAPEINLPQKEGPIAHMSDTWSLGVMLYEMFSPRKEDEKFAATALRPFPYVSPFKGRNSIDEFVKKDAAGRYKQLLLKPLGSNYQLHRLIMEMLDPDPLKRPSLEAVLEHPLIARYSNPMNDGERAVVAGARRTILAYARPAES